MTPGNRKNRKARPAEKTRPAENPCPCGRAALRLLAAALCAAVLLCGCAGIPWYGSHYAAQPPAAPAGTTSLPTAQPRTAPEKPETRPRRLAAYGEMEYTRPNLAALRAGLLAIEGQMAEAESFDALLAQKRQADALAEGFYTMHTLAMLAKYHNTGHLFYEEEYRVLERFSVTLAALENGINAHMVNGPFAEEYKAHVGAYRFASIKNNLLLNSADVEDYKTRRKQLAAAYNTQLATLALPWEGQDYTLGDIARLADKTLAAKLEKDFYAAFAQQFAALYAQIVQLDKAMAAELGFSSAAQMYYLANNRDYTPQQGLALARQMQAAIGPMAGDVFGWSYDAGPAEMDVVFGRMEEALGAVHPDMAAAWRAMEAYGLYDCAPAADKQAAIGFTTYIPGWDAPFVYTNWAGDFASATGLMHEFGHFYDFWLRYDEETVFCLDLAETYSQGLALLMQAQFARFTEKPGEAVMAQLQDFVNVLVYQSLLEDFQQQVYAMEELSAEGIGGLYAALLQQYGLGWASAAGQGDVDNSWFAVTHLFDSPFYTISYVTSALAALQVWTVACEDWNRAVDIYLAMLYADQNQPFAAVLQGAGLHNVFGEDVVESTRAGIAGVFGLEDEAQAA